MDKDGAIGESMKEVGTLAVVLNFKRFGSGAKAMSVVGTSRCMRKKGVNPFVTSSSEMPIVMEVNTVYEEDTPEIELQAKQLIASLSNV
jgi:hypothetical protein